MFDMKRFNRKKLIDVEVEEQYHVKISNRFAALENLDDDDDDRGSTKLQWLQNPSQKKWGQYEQCKT
jgi:hypothetical protein